MTYISWHKRLTITILISSDLRTFRNTAYNNNNNNNNNNNSCIALYPVKGQELEALIYGLAALHIILFLFFITVVGELVFGLAGHSGKLDCTITGCVR